jgi:uncharacterized protein (DUF2237 family)
MFVLNVDQNFFNVLGQVVEEASSRPLVGLYFQVAVEGEKR